MLRFSRFAQKRSNQRRVQSDLSLDVTIPVVVLGNSGAAARRNSSMTRTMKPSCAFSASSTAASGYCLYSETRPWMLLSDSVNPSRPSPRRCTSAKTTSFGGWRRKTRRPSSISPESQRFSKPWEGCHGRQPSIVQDPLNRERRSLVLRVRRLLVDLFCGHAPSEVRDCRRIGCRHHVFSRREVPVGQPAASNVPLHTTL